MFPLYQYGFKHHLHCILVLVKTGIGVSNNLERRVYEHKKNLVKRFTSEYSVPQLVYYEETNDIYAALQREKQLKTCPHENGEMEPQMEVDAHREGQS